METYYSAGYQHADGWIGGGTMANSLDHAKRMLASLATSNKNPSTAVAAVVYRGAGKRAVVVESIPLASSAPRAEAEK